MKRKLVKMFSTHESLRNWDIKPPLTLTLKGSIDIPKNIKVWITRPKFPVRLGIFRPPKIRNPGLSNLKSQSTKIVPV
jgi:hypothetical protein